MRLMRFCDRMIFKPQSFFHIKVVKKGVISANKYDSSFTYRASQWKGAVFENGFPIRDQSLIIPGEGAEDIWEGGPKFYPLKGRGDEKLSTP